MALWHGRPPTEILQKAWHYDCVHISEIENAIAREIVRKLKNQIDQGYHFDFDCFAIDMGGSKHHD